MNSNEPYQNPGYNLCARLKRTDLNYISGYYHYYYFCFYLQPSRSPCFPPEFRNDSSVPLCRSGLRWSETDHEPRTRRNKQTDRPHPAAEDRWLCPKSTGALGHFYIDPKELELRPLSHWTARKGESIACDSEVISASLKCPR